MNPGATLLVEDCTISGRGIDSSGGGEDLDKSDAGIQLHVRTPVKAVRSPCVQFLFTAGRLFCLIRCSNSEHNSSNVSVHPFGVDGRCFFHSDVYAASKF